MAEQPETVEDNLVPDYQVAKKVTVDQLLTMDTQDESLRKYKEALLGAAAKEVFAPKDDPRRAVIVEFKVGFENRPAGDITYKLDEAGALEKLKTQPFTLKEGCNYKISITFRIQHEIVSGLKYVNVVTRHGIKVSRDEAMLGSYAPQKEAYTVTFPRIGWEEAPSGMLARGHYKAKSQFIDDDKTNHMEFDYEFELKKDW